MSNCRCGLSTTAPLTNALQMRFDQLIGWAKAGKASEYYLMDTANVDGLSGALIGAVYEELAAHTADRIEANTTDNEWCTTPACVRPVSFHPNSMHLTEDGREFGGDR